MSATERKPVDVLDVMASAASLLRDMHPRDNSPTGNDLREARAAVAELMAERDRYENALYQIANGDLRPGCIGSITKARMGEIARAALARVGGA